MHSRRARPTLGVLYDYLNADWESPWPQRMLRDGSLNELHPLSELPHPIIRKAAESFGLDSTADNCVGAIQCSTELNLWEIKAGQWRGGVWKDPESGVHWLVAAGLAKGDHNDRDDFYKRIEREVVAGQSTCWLPKENDVYLLKQETAARILTEWELRVQEQVQLALQAVGNGGVTRFETAHPILGDVRVAEWQLSVERVRGSGVDSDDICLTVTASPSYRGTELLWQLIIRVLISLSLDPPMSFRWGGLV